MVERAGLEIRYSGFPLSGVRIPLSPPVKKQNTPPRVFLFFIRSERGMRNRRDTDEFEE